VGPDDRSGVPAGAQPSPGARSQEVDADTRSQDATGASSGPPHASPNITGHRFSGRARSALIGGLIVALGLAISAFLASSWRSSSLHANKKSFQSTVADLGDALDAKLQTKIELTRTMRSIATMEPNAGDTRFLQWYHQLQHRAPASPDVTAVFIQEVPASGLSAFRAQAEADPTYRKLLHGSFQIVPAGSRPPYCLTRATVPTPTSTSAYPPLLNYCAAVLPSTSKSPYATLIRMERDTGGFIVTPLPGVGVSSLIGLGEAVYRRGAALATVTARRAAFRGVIGTSFNSAALLRTLLAGHSSLTLTLYHRNVGGPLQLIGRAGANPNGRSPGYSERDGLGEGWLVEASGTAYSPLAADAQGLIALGVGLLVTLLILLLYLLLSSSRLRAWGLVGEQTDEMEYRALHDPLTDLPNRILVLDRAEQILARGRRQDVPVTALFVDIDDFKQINDRFGHHAGDEVLRQVGARLKTVLRDNDTVGRLGGDEFVMLIDSLGLDAAPELVAERILDVLRQPIHLPDSSHPPICVTASIGIATGRPPSAEGLMQDADLALYKAKAVGKDGYVKFEFAMQTAAQDRIHLEVDLGNALAAKQFFLVYQPMLDLENEQVVGVEALLRWSHPSGETVPPDAFIPFAEESGLIVSIGRWVLEQACAQGAAWREQGHPLNISVNVSARQLERAEFVQEVRAALDASGLDPAMLTLEITETVLMRKPDTTARLLEELKALGVRIAVDDFGTGYSSLAYLRQFPVDSLKIDRTFITGLALSSEAHALTHTLIQLGKALGLQTLAEGVEEHSQVRALQLEGCDLAQGFLFARPLTPDALERFLIDSTGPGGPFAEARAQPASSRLADPPLVDLL
jgi:diguanylate cyclase (GGDEF)-like protein